MKKFDLIVIGSGSGYKVADYAAHELGWKVALIEEGPLGGTCLNRGCIPSKILIQSAHVTETIKQSEKFGIESKIKKIDFKKIIERSNNYIDPISKHVEDKKRKDNKITLYKKHAEFIDDHRLNVSGEGIYGKKILIAAGSRPAIPPIKGINEVDYITSTQALRLKKQPESMIIIGGGYIAAELGQFYAALGTKITVIDRSEYLVSNEDWEIAKKLTEICSKDNRILLQTSAVAVKQIKNGVQVTVKDKKGNTKNLRAEKLMVAAGITPNTDNLKVRKTGVKMDKKGFIKVNSYMQTNKDHIWSIGDINGQYPFRHAANYEASIINHNLKSKKKSRADYTAVPHAIFSSPQIGSVGITEQQAKSKKIKYSVKKYEFEQTARGKALEEKNGFVKYIVDKKGKILGCHIIGPHASVLIHEVVVAMNAPGSNIDLLQNSIHIHPSLNEAVWWAISK